MQSTSPSSSTATRSIISTTAPISLTTIGDDYTDSGSGSGSGEDEDAVSRSSPGEQSHDGSGHDSDEDAGYVFNTVPHDRRSTDEEDELTDGSGHDDIPPSRTELVASTGTVKDHATGWQELESTSGGDVPSLGSGEDPTSTRMSASMSMSTRSAARTASTSSSQFDGQPGLPWCLGAVPCRCRAHERPTYVIHGEECQM